MTLGLEQQWSLSHWMCLQDLAVRGCARGYTILKDWLQPRLFLGRSGGGVPL